jgi:polysaccharide pyruvyl transferase WcaK-like protein
LKFAKVNIIGYYDHDNLGDEQYKYTITYLLRQINKSLNVDNINFIDCDKINKSKLDPKDLYIIGGGDVLTDYFLDKLKFFNEEKYKNTTIISMSTGLPYHNYKIITKLSFIDYFFMRNTEDVKYLKQFFKNKVFYLPDACFLSKRIKFTPNKTITHHKNNLKNILICPTYFSQDKKINENFKDFLCNFIIELNKKYNIYLYPFGEKDESLCLDIISTVNNFREITTENIYGNISYIYINTNKADNFINMIKNSNISYVIPMRFHSVLYSMIYNIPFFPIFATSKIKKFLDDVKWNNYYFIDFEKKLDLDYVLKYFKQFTRVDLYKKLRVENLKIETDLYKGVENIKNILENYKLDKSKLITPNDILVEFNQEKDENDKEFLVKLVSYRITKTTNSEYNWGLLDKMFKENFDWNEELYWVFNDFYSIKKEEYNNPSGKFNINYFNQEDYSSSHRAGWNYVYNTLKYYSNDSSDLILDLYIDRTFGWDYTINSYLKMIPYEKLWSGFIHHTFDTSFSEYNIYEYFEKENFIKSLKYCKCFFVLSDYLKSQLEYYLRLFNFKIPVYSLVHPTDFNVKKFKFKNFDVKKFKLLHVGGWLRNIYSFYKLSGIHNKFLLKGKNMNNYIPPKDLIIECKDNENTDIYKMICPDKPCCPNRHCTNQWVKDFKKDVEQTINSVKIIEHLSNQEYDDLLSKNVVFINLHDGSAVNTIIECIVRNTPIIVNKCPLTIEIFGENYPLFYNNYVNDFSKTNEEVKNLLKCFNIYKAYIYLSCMNKKKYSIEYFIETFLKYI